METFPLYLCNMIVEACCNSIASAQAAQAAGVHRIEFCVGLPLGGLTPSRGLLETYLEEIYTPTRVLIRPREGDFTYSSEEFKAMLADVSHCVGLGFEGVVSGVLHSDLSLDIERTQELVAAAGPGCFSFHRAFDWVQQPQQTLEALSAMGVHTLLSSGAAPTAAEGLPLLKKLLAMDSGVEIMPGSGVNAANAHTFKSEGFKALHLSAVGAVPFLSTAPKVSMNSPAMLSDTKRFVSQQSQLESLLRVLSDPPQDKI